MQSRSTEEGCLDGQTERNSGMAKVRLINNNTVEIEVTALNALTIAGGSLAGGLPGHEKIIPPQRVSAGKIRWQVPSQSAANYALLAFVPEVPGTPASNYEIQRTITQAVGGAKQTLPPSSVNPRTSRLTSKMSNGHYRYAEIIELI